MEDDIGYDFVDPENFKNSQVEAYSHGVLVMLIMKKCIDSGAVELREGYTNTKTDRYGNKIQTVVPDTRKIYINCVQTLEDVMECDLDKEAKEEIEALDKSFLIKSNSLLELDQQMWETLHPQLKLQYNSTGIYQRKGYFTKAFPIIDDFLEEKIIYSRKKFKIFNRLADRVGLGEEKYIEA